MSTRAPYRLDLWTAPRPAGGTRVAFLVEPGGGRAALNVQCTESIVAGQSRLSFDVLPDYHAVAALAPGGIVALSRVVPTGADSYELRVREWRITSRARTVHGGLGPYRIQCVPLEEDLLDVDLYREVGSGGLATWRYGATDRLPADVLADIRDRLLVLGYSYVVVGTCDPTTPVTFELLGVATPRAIADALTATLVAAGVDAEFQCVLSTDLTTYRLEVVTRIAGTLAALRATTDANAQQLTYGEDALEQATVVIPFTSEGIDARELQLELAAVDGGTGWCTLQAIGGGAAVMIAADDQFNGARLFRESTGRSFAIVDTSASPMRVQLAVADLASGLAAGERVSFRASEDNAGTRRAFATAARWSPLEVVSTLTGPPRIRTRDLYLSGASIAAANQFRDWTAQRSTLVAALPTGNFDHVTGILALSGAPAANPAIDDWVWFWNGTAYVPGTVTAYNAGTFQVTLTPRYSGTQFATSLAGITSRCYRPIGTPIWILSSTVANGELTVDAFNGGTPAAGDVLEIAQRCQGVRQVEFSDPAAVASTRRKVARVDVECTGATNRVTNGDCHAWAGASGDPPDGWSIESIVGTVTRSRVSDPLLTRYGGFGWQLAFDVGASAEVFTPRIPIHSVPGADQVAVAVALLFSRFAGNAGFTVTLYAVTAAGVRTALGELSTLTLYPLDATVATDEAFKPALDTWYDATLTNQSVAALGDQQLQIGIARPAGASNPLATVVIDAAMLLQREGLPQVAEGGVRYIEGSDALPLLTAANAALRDRANPLVRLEGRLLDVFRIDATRYTPYELVPGRDVAVTILPLELTRTVRLLSRTANEDDPASVQVDLDRLRPDVGRMIAAGIPKPTTPVPATPRTPSPAALVYPWLTLRDVVGETSVSIEWAGAPAPIEYSVNGGSWTTITTSPLIAARPANGSASLSYAVRTGLGDLGTREIKTVRIDAQLAVPPASPAITSASLASGQTPGDGGGQVNVNFTFENMPVGATFTIDAVSTAGDPITAASASASGITASPYTLSMALGPGAALDITITAYTSGAVFICDYQFSSAVPV